MNDRYSRMSEGAMFGFLANALDMRGRSDSDGDKGCSYPRSDAEDQSRGARFIPGSVTLARRRGEKVEFVTECGSNCWYWKMQDGSRIYHYDPFTYDQIGEANGRKKVEKDGRMTFENGVGPCPHCGNEHTHGGPVKA